MTRTLNSAAWGGRVVFQTRHISFGLLEEADDMTRRIQEQCPELPERLNLNNLSLMLVATPDIEFNFEGDENPPLEELRDFWQAFKAAQPASQVELAIHWYKYTTNDVIAKWLEALNQASMSVRRVEQLPPNLLTEEERAELEDPTSPLAESVPSS